ncbi:ABC transporter substrate-binding protein [Caballeronia sp. DA-9]|uniref:ABC transporter substrate-binding protein n=1 Tax=Caballeronia sp. DA-9 TaxID=3436237 RepID=UPI003F6612B1
MNSLRIIRATCLAFAVILGVANPAAATELRVGYWTSGISLGFGAVLEAQKFFEKQGLQVKFFHFPDVNGPTTALASNAIDLAFGASLAGALSMSQQGAPVRIIAATQIVDAEIAVLDSSPVKSLGELRGKKIGMSPVGSATTGVATAVLEGNQGLKQSDYRLVSGDEPRLAQFLQMKNVDAAVLRPTTIAQVSDSASKLRVITTLAAQWQQMTKSTTPPYIGVAVMRDEWLKANPEDAAKVITAMRQALKFGTDDPAAVKAILKEASNMSDQGAMFYSDHWGGMNTVSFKPDDIATLKRTFEVFKSAGTLKGDLPQGLFYQQPYLESEKSR